MFSFLSRKERHKTLRCANFCVFLMIFSQRRMFFLYYIHFVELKPDLIIVKIFLGGKFFFKLIYRACISNYFYVQSLRRLTCDANLFNTWLPIDLQSTKLRKIDNSSFRQFLWKVEMLAMNVSLSESK